MKKSQHKVTGRPTLSPINEKFLKQLRKKAKLMRSQLQLYLKFNALNIKVLGIDEKRPGKSKIASLEAYQQIQIEGMSLEDKQNIINQFRSTFQSYQFRDYLEKKEKGVFSDNMDLSYVLFCLRNSNLFQKQQISIPTQVYIALILFKEKHRIFQKTLEILVTKIPKIITNLQKVYNRNQQNGVQQLNEMEQPHEILEVQDLMINQQHFAQQFPLYQQQQYYLQQQQQQQQLNYIQQEAAQKQKQKQKNQNQNQSQKKTKNGKTSKKQETNLKTKKRIRKPKQIKNMASQEQKEQIINSLCQQICIYIHSSYVYALQE